METEKQNVSGEGKGETREEGTFISHSNLLLGSSAVETPFWLILVKSSSEWGWQRSTDDQRWWQW